MAEVFLWGLLAHLVADWFLQTNWMAQFKVSLRHPASWVHSGIHLACALLVFHPLIALWLFATHIITDTRNPLIVWRKLAQQSRSPVADPTKLGESIIQNAVFISFSMWQDQAVHLIMLILAAKMQVVYGH